MIKSFFFTLRLMIAWGALFLLAAIVLSNVPPFRGSSGDWYGMLILFTLIMVAIGAMSHLHRVRMIAGKLDAATLANRQRRQIELPFDADEVFELLDAIVRELPRAQITESARDSLQIRARIVQNHGAGATRWLHWLNPFNWLGSRHNQVFATVTPGSHSASVALICEPEAGAWSDWLRVDDGSNLVNAEAITRALSRRVAERRRAEKRAATDTATAKELAEARLNLLHAQVEPHFLYNTLSSAQILTRSEPPLADKMLGHLIQYLRHSLPRTEERLSTLGEELERTRAYLEILKIRMGNRLTLEVDVPDGLRPLPLPPMVLQTLVENAIKHGLEPKPGGGTVWLRARRDGERVTITVADDGMGFGQSVAGTGVGLKNVRERLQLIYAGAASLAVVANAPAGVAATLSVPADAQSAGAGVEHSHG